MNLSSKKKIIIGVAAVVVIVLVSTVAIMHLNSSESTVTAGADTLKVEISPVPLDSSTVTNSSVKASQTPADTDPGTGTNRIGDLSPRSSSSSAIVQNSSDEIVASGSSTPESLPVSNSPSTDSRVELQPPAPAEITSTTNGTSVLETNPSTGSTPDPVVTSAESSNSVSGNIVAPISAVTEPIASPAPGKGSNDSMSAVFEEIRARNSPSPSGNSNSSPNESSPAPVSQTERPDTVISDFTSSTPAIEPQVTSEPELESTSKSNESDQQVSSDTPKTVDNPPSSSTETAKVVTNQELPAALLGTRNNTPPTDVPVIETSNSEQQPQQQQQLAPSTSNVSSASNSTSVSLVHCNLKDIGKKERTYTVSGGFFGSDSVNVVPYGAFDIKLTEEGPAAYRVFYVNNGGVKNVEDYKKQISAALVEGFKIKENISPLKEYKSNGAIFYKTEIMDEDDKDEIGPSFVTMKRQIHYSGMEKFMNSLQTSDLGAWKAKTVFFIVPSDGAKLEEYIFEKTADPKINQLHGEIIKRDTFSIYGTVEVKHLIRSTKIENIFGHSNLMALNFDFSRSETVTEIQGDAFNDLMEYEKRFNTVTESSIDQLTILHNANSPHVEKLLQKIKSDGLKAAFDYHFQNATFGFYDISFLVIGPKDQLQLYTKVKDSDYVSKRAVYFK